MVAFSDTIDRTGRTLEEGETDVIVSRAAATRRYQIDRSDRTLEEGEADVIASRAAATQRFQIEAEEDRKEAPGRTETRRIYFLPRDLTFQDMELSIVRGPWTGLIWPRVSSEKVDSYGSPATALAYSREKIADHLKDVTELLIAVKESFEDEMDRQILFFEVKEHLGKLWEIDFPGNDYFLQAVSLLEDSLVYNKSEDLVEDQIEGLLEVVGICNKIDLSIDDVRRCVRIMRSRRIATLPDLR